jgi:hypothetical protein
MSATWYLKGGAGSEPGRRPGTWSIALRSKAGSSDGGELSKLSKLSKLAAELSMLAGRYVKGCEGCVANALWSIGSGK